jgi:hypothetical protein
VPADPERPGGYDRRKERLMPTIIVISNESAEHDSAVVLSENVQPEHFASGHHADQLIERLGWAVSDAKEAETEATHTRSRR